MQPAGVENLRWRRFKAGKNLMQSEQEHARANGGNSGFEMTACPSCRASMVQGMRFCRFCGFRLGEGVADYAETMRLPNNATTFKQAPAADTAGTPHAWGALAPSMQTTALGRTGSSWPRRVKMMSCSSSRKGSSWLMWMIIFAIVMSAAGGSAFKAVRRARGGAAGTVQSAPRSYFGVNAFENADGGALLDYVSPPDSPADKAGLVGGDIVKSFDGQAVSGRMHIMRLLGATPVGKTVEVEFIRDGQTKRTTMTTISKEEMDRLEEAFDERAEGKGFFGIETNKLTDSVFVPELNVKGVRLGEVLTNRPAYIAGLRDGDIVVEFDGVPIRTEGEFVARFRRALPDSTVKVVVVRAGQRIEIPVKMGRG